MLSTVLVELLAGGLQQSQSSQIPEDRERDGRRGDDTGQGREEKYADTCIICTCNICTCY